MGARRIWGSEKKVDQEDHMNIHKDFYTFECVPVHRGKEYER